MPDPGDATLRLAVAQLAPRFGDVAANTARISELRAASSADLLVTPELSLTGYDLRDRAAELAMPLGGLSQFAKPGEPAVTIGYAEQGAPGAVYNSAAVFGGEALHNHRKLYLPTYGMFDEGRYFGRGDLVSTFDVNGWRLGLLICEDFWHPALTYLLACQNIEALIVMAAAPGRGVWEGGEFGPFASSDVWERMARVTAQLHGIYVALCNRVGVESGITFAGDSLVAGPSGDLLARAGASEETLEVTLSKAEIRRARTPYAHLRDELPELLRSELARLFEGPRIRPPLHQ